MLIPYIRPTRNKHDSGYNKFECGYLDADEGANPTHKYVVSNRIWSNGVDVKWLTESDLFSDMDLVAGTPNALTKPEPIEDITGKGWD